MQSYTVHEPPNPAADRVDRAESLVFVKDGFSWGAALFGPLWMIAHRLWWALLAYVVAYAGFEVLRSMAVVDQNWIGLGLFAVNMLVAFEGDTLRRWALGRRGWRMLGAVTGKNRDECERRFFDAWLPGQPAVQAHWTPAGGGKSGRSWILGRLAGAGG